MRIVFFDLETGGLDPRRHAIIQIAAIAVDADCQEIDQFEVKLRFDPAQADAEALEANSYDAETWASEAVDPHEAQRALTAFLRRFSDVELISKRTGNPYNVAQLAGHNAATFDGPFLAGWYKQTGEFLPAAWSVLCTLQRSLWYFQENPKAERPENLKLGTLAQHFGIEHDNAHDAMTDVRATVELYKALTNRR